MLYAYTGNGGYFNLHTFYRSTGDVSQPQSIAVGSNGNSYGLALGGTWSGGTLTSNAAFAMSQEDPNSPDVASDVATTPVEYSGTADSTYQQKFGRLDFSLKGNLERDVYGPTTLKDGTSVDNTDQNNTQLGGTLRLGFQVTPVFQLFGDSLVIGAIQVVVVLGVGEALFQLGAVSVKGVGYVLEKN